MTAATVLNIDRILKLPPTKALIACLLIAIGWFASREINKEEKDEKKVEKNDKVVAALQRKIDSLSTALVTSGRDCDKEKEAKDAEFKQYLLNQLAENNKVKQRALNAEKKVDPAINQAINQTITRLTNEHQNISNEN